VGKETTKYSKSSLLKTLSIFKFFMPFKMNFVGGLLFLFLSSAGTLAFPYFLGDIMDTNSIAEINRLAIILITIFAANAIFSYFRIYLFEYVTQKGLQNLKAQVYSKLITLPLSYYSSKRTGELTSRLSNDISLLQTTLTTSSAEFIRQIITIAGGIVLLTSISLKLTGFMLLVVPVIALIAVIFGKLIKKLAKQTQNTIADSNIIVEETLQSINTVKSFTNEQYEISRYQNILKDVVLVSLKATKYRGAFVSFIIMGLFGSIIGVIWYGLILKSQNEITQGDLFSFILYTVFVGASFGGVANVFSQIVKSIGATENLLEILEETNEDIETEYKNNYPGVVEGKIEFDQVNFHYPNRKESVVLNNLSFKIESGQQLAIVGPSGAGKSTIVSLLLRHYDPTIGTIKIDGNPIRDYPLTWLRKQIAIVPQDIILFAGTIKDNIAYGNLDASLSDVTNAAEDANAHEFISLFPDGYNTLVGERGIQLSGGQRQRIAIARAILKKPKILILDEATSSLDSESEQLVQTAIQKLLKGKTAVVIAHRLSTIKSADKIIYLKQGALMEEGNFDELNGLTNGYFKRLNDLQIS
jgi:ABC-type multidrug transport system fused ATPase/permease subunit|tara:strand:- start:12983 stop:14737 length:1755 start_codon:yes stop_codon:yes gene_type:complete